MPLYGHELSAAITPLEAQLGRFVKLDKPGGFIGRDALAQQKAQGVPRKRVGLELLDRGIAREGAPVYAGDACIGQVTSGTVPPTLGKALCMALLASPHAAPGAQVQVEVRGRRLAARLIPMPFYKRSTKTI